MIAMASLGLGFIVFCIFAYYSTEVEDEFNKWERELKEMELELDNL